MEITLGKIDGAIKLAHRAVETKFEDFTEKEVLAAKKSILDNIGVTLAGTTMGNKCHELVAFAKENGGREESSIWGYGGKVPAMLAAFANGAVIHSLDYDECYDMSGTHPSASILPALIAVMEKSGNVNGKDLVTSLIVGSDIIYRIGLAADSIVQKEYGVFAAFAKSYFGSAAACGKALRLTKDEMVSCIGLAYAQTAGPMQVLYEADSNVRETFTAFSGKVGVISAYLAQRGVKGTRDSLEGTGGYFNAFARGAYDPTPLDVKIGDEFKHVNVTTKPYPSCRVTHMFIDATRKIMGEHGVTADQVVKVTLKVGKFGQVLCVPEESRKKPLLPMDARFSIPYCVASTLVNGTVGVAQITPQSIKDPKVLAVAQKIDYVMDESLGVTSIVEPGGVTIELVDGRSYYEFVSASLGSPENPLSLDALIAKFRDCASYSRKPLAKESVDKVIELCLNLEKVRDIREIIQLIN